MEKLLNKFSANPCLDMAIKVCKYEYKHPFATCTLTEYQHDLLDLARLIYREAQLIYQAYSLSRLY